MNKHHLGSLIAVFLFLPLALVSETTIIKNATVYMPNNTYQKNSFILINGAKIDQIGFMTNLKQAIYDNEYDAKNGFVYPGFIDPYYLGMLKKPAKATSASRRQGVDKTKRKPIDQRNYFIKKRLCQNLNLSKTKAKKTMENGFFYLHVVPRKGIIGGTTTVISLVSDRPQKAILIADKFLSLAFRTNSGSYPSTLSSLIAELNQFKIDTLYYHKMKNLQFHHPSRRLEYVPEYEILLPYFQKSKRFLIETKNITQQHMFEILAQQLNINAVMVANADIWRRRVNPSTDVILPLNFKPSLASRYSRMGEKLKKEAEKKIYPKKIAEFINNHEKISLTPPASGDYKTLFKNIRTLIKEGVAEATIMNALTINPAQLLGLSQYAGTISPGKLASLIIYDKKIFADKVKVKKLYVEGLGIEIKKKSGKLKPPASNISGSWTVKVESAMANMEFRMNLTQDENSLSGKLISEMGEMEISEGTISGDKVSISITAPIMGQDMKVNISGTVKDMNITGTISFGSMGEGSFHAIKDDRTGGRQ